MTTTAAKRTTTGGSLKDANATDTIGLEEAARMLDIPLSVLSLRTARGDLPSTATDGQTRFQVADLSAFKRALELQRAAQRELADITEELMSVHGL